MIGFKNFAGILVLSILASCIYTQERGEAGQLPILGRKQITEKEINGEIKLDTAYHKIGDFRFVDQDSNWVTNETFSNKVYVADFFFTSCPTICPIMKSQMMRVYDAYEDNPEVAFLSHTIDPEYDTVALLKDYSEKLGVSSDKWHFVTGDKKQIYNVGQKSYMVTADENSNAPGGFIHSGAFLLVDKKRRIRGVYDGTKEEDVDRLIKDISLLLRRRS